MRTLFIAVTFLFSVSIVSAQTPLVKRAFDEGTKFANAGEFDRALKAYRTAALAAGDDAGEFAVKLQYNLGVCNYRLGKLRPAVADFNAAIRLSNGRHPRAYYALGMTESALEHWPAAKKAFLASLELAPGDGEAWFDLAFVHLAEHDYDNAAAAFRKSIENRSVDSALGHNNLGVIMAMKHEFDAAETAFNAALRLTSGRLIEARQNLEFCRKLRGPRKVLLATTELSFATRLRGLFAV